MKHLTELANIYTSDKGTKFGSKHGFSDIYHDYLNNLINDNITLLEIGINNGESLKMWYDFFPNATIIGLDIHDKTFLNNDRITCYIIDQSDENQLNDFIKNNNQQFNIIIDDGSHHMKDQQITIGCLFPMLLPGGIYIIEDLHTSLCEPNTMIYGKPIEINETRDNTTLYWLKNFSTPKFTSVYLSEIQNNMLQKTIESIQIFEKNNIFVPNEYKNSSITSIIKKNNE